LGTKNDGRFVPKYDWERIGETIITRYLAGDSTAILSAETQIPVCAIAAYIGRHGKRRSAKEAKATSRQQGRMNTVPKNKRVCRICREEFQPNGPNQQRCKACIPNNRFNEYYNRYGVSKREWDRILLAQNGTCALCPNAPEHIDHCHASNVVRGLLCAGCNQALNRIEQPGWAERATTYVREADTGCRINEKSGYWIAWRTTRKLRKSTTLSRALQVGKTAGVDAREPSGHG
jgi:hypothetical protein